jgi:hypothetical protein
MNMQTTIWDNGNIEINADMLTTNKIYSLRSVDLSQNILTDYLKTICEFHCSRLNITHITNVEYCYNDKPRKLIEQFKTNDDLKLKLIFFTENVDKNCLICTDIGSDAYKYKKFNNHNRSLKIVRQNIKNHICIDPNVYTYSNAQDQIRTLDVYIYSDKSDKTILTKNGEFHLSDILPTRVFIGERLDYSYYNDILYNNKHNHDFINKIIIEDKRICPVYEVLNNPEVEQSIESINNELKSLICINNINRFTNRFVYNNAFDKTTCNWILNAFLSKKYGNYISELNTFPMAYNYTIFTLTNYILPFVNKCYMLDKSKYIIDIFESKILNVTNGFEVNIIKNQNNNSFTINILLSETNNSSDEYFTFKDGTKQNIKQGDAIIFYTDLKCKKCNLNAPLYILNIQFNLDIEKTEQRVL